MSEVAFHILGEDSDVVRLKTTCSLIERAYLGGERVLVWLDDANQQASFDNLLWTFADRAFVPHEPLADDPTTCEAPVQLTSSADLPSSALPGGFTALFNLRAEAHLSALKFAKVVEVIDANPGRRNAGRARFRFYREHGSEPQHHEVVGKA
jgi:DNA polymerase III subunit chi